MTHAVSFLDLGATYRRLAPQLDAAVARALASGWYIMGPEVEAFEAEYARYCGARHCIAVANGLDALILSLRARGIGPGDDVLVPSNTYIATWLAVTEVGARVVPVEPDPVTCNMCPEAARAAWTPRTRAILPVHLYGQPADLDGLLALAREHGAFVLDDAAQAHGATWHGRPIGGLCDASAWSFYPSKNLGAFGDGGAVTTNDDALADRLRVLRNYGSRRKYQNELRGTNSRLDPIQAAILRVKLAELDAWNAERNAQAARYLSRLASCDGLVLPACDARATHVWHCFVVRTTRREALMTWLADRRIGTLIHYPIAPHLQEAYADHGWGPGSFPRAEQLHQEVLSLPCGPHLTLADIDVVCDHIEAFFDGATA